MHTASEATEHTIRLAEQHITQQEARIGQQKALISSLEVQGHTEMAQSARQLLTEMMSLLAQMHDDLNGAQARLADRQGD